MFVNVVVEHRAEYINRNNEMTGLAFVVVDLLRARPSASSICARVSGLS